MTEYGTLKRIVVGVENFENTKIVDVTLKHFFKDNLKDYFRDESFTSYTVSDKVISERKEDLDNLASTLSALGIEVVRPQPCHRLKQIKTPFFNSVFYSNSNVRDLTLTLRNKIITAQSTVRSRYFENILLNDILYQEIFKYKKQVLSPPLGSLADETIDFSEWREWVDKKEKNIDLRYEVLFDAANCIKVTPEDIIMNIGTQNAYNSYIWLKSLLPEINVHPVYLCDNHIDGTILPIDEGTFLVNACFLRQDIRSYMPEKFKNWNYIEVNDRKLDPAVYDQSTLTGVQLATYEGIDINVLSISPKKIIVQSSATSVIDKLEKNGYDLIPIQFRHSTIFGGGVHCSTLDLERDE